MLLYFLSVAQLLLNSHIWIPLSPPVRKHHTQHHSKLTMRAAIIIAAAGLAMASGTQVGGVGVGLRSGGEEGGGGRRSGR